MFLLMVCFLVSAALVVLRYGLLAKLRRSSCPKCRSDSFVRKKRKRSDRLLGKAFNLPIERYRCIHYRCGWEGSLIYRPHPRDQTVKSDPQSIPVQNLSPSRSLESRVQVNHEKLTSQQALIQALEENEFKLYYQSSFDFETKNITGVEALLRWKHPERGLMPPAAFIPLADDNGFIFSLGQWILNQACCQVLQWHQKGLYPLRISVNLSSRQFYEPNLVETIAQVLGQTGLNSQFLEIEIDENEILQHLDLATSILRDLHYMGVRLTIDNFGVSRVPRRYLRRIALNTLKLNQSLVHSLRPETENIEVVRSFVRLAQSLDLDVVANGVETREQLYLLQLLGCKAAQGYLFEAPSPNEDTTDILQANWLGRREEAIPKVS